MADLKPAYLLTGSDRPKIARALERLRAHMEDEAIELLSARDSSANDVVAACNALGLFGDGTRLVIVDEVDGRRNSDGRLTGGWKAADVKAIVDYLASPTPGTVLALVAEEVKASSPLGKACAKAGEVLNYDVAKRGLATWVAKQFGLHGAQAEPDACRALVEIVGEDLDALANEVAKLATWAAGETIGVRDVEAVAAGFAETKIFALTDAWGRRDVGGVLAACEAILDRASAPRRDEIPRLVGGLITHVARVRECQMLAAEGVRARDAAVTMKKSPYYVEKLFDQASNFGVEELREAIVQLAAVDHATKGGSRLAPDLELQRALVAMTQQTAAQRG